MRSGGVTGSSPEFHRVRTGRLTVVRVISPPNPELEALEEDRLDLAVQISLLLDKGVDFVTVSELRKRLFELEKQIARSRKRRT